MEFLKRLKSIFDEIPIKTKFLKDLGFNNSYSGFRYFMQDRKETPSKKLMEGLCKNIDYEYITIPVKLDAESQTIKKELEDKFFEDLEEYLKQYEGDVSRTYARDFGGDSSIANALSSFKEDSFDFDAKIDASNLF